MKNKIIISIFMLLELLFGVLLHVSNTLFDANIYEYGCIILCLMFSIIYTKKFSFIFLGIIFTVFADLFLVILAKYAEGFTYSQVFGLGAFCFVQLFYFMYLFKNENKITRIISLITRLVLMFTATLIIIFIIKTRDIIVFLSTYYYINLLLNIIFSFVGGKDYIMFSIGLVLLSLCDLYIGVLGAPDIFVMNPNSLIYKIFNVEFNMAWLFYVPSQVLIALYYRKKQNDFLIK